MLREKAMTHTPRNVAVLGCSGSIGTATLEVLASHRDRFRLWGVSAHRNVECLLRAVDNFSPAAAILTDDETAVRSGFSEGISAGDQGRTCRRLVGGDALVELATAPEVDIVVAAIVGSAGLPSALAAAKAGKRLALANKEALVVAGPLLTTAAAESGAELLPIDSEHSAIFQAAQAAEHPRQIDRLILTASGGSLRDWPLQRLSEATVDDALNHPTWRMGAKITVDSATMMNKALEVIEARWLFGVEASKISVVIHPQSTIHSMVEFVDGSVLAQLSPPDMRLPIQYALTYPERLPCAARKVDWSEPAELRWHPADMERYPALGLGFEVAEAGGSSGAVLNAANEAAVELFLNRKLSFTDIAAAVADVLHNHTLDCSPTLEDLMRLDRWARAEVGQWASKKKLVARS
jgi:1-deoxy-D-xylulose-5-phosphate reductoisomerase